MKWHCTYLYSLNQSNRAWYRGPSCDTDACKNWCILVLIFVEVFVQKGPSEHPKGVCAVVMQPWWWMHPGLTNRQHFNNSWSSSRWWTWYRHTELSVAWQTFLFVVCVPWPDPCTHLWQFGGVELESKALTKIARKEGGCVSQLFVLFIPVARNRLERENASPFPFHESRKRNPHLNSFRIELYGARFTWNMKMQHLECSRFHSVPAEHWLPACKFPT